MRYFIDNYECIAPNLNIKDESGQRLIYECINVACYEGNAGIVAILNKHMNWENKNEALYDSIQVSLQNNKFITTKALLIEMSHLITNNCKSFNSRHVATLWSIALKAGNESILKTIYKLWLCVSNSFKDTEQEHLKQLAIQYDIQSQDEIDSACTLLYHAIRLEIPDQVNFIFRHLPTYSPTDILRRFEEKNYIDPMYFSKKHHGISEILHHYTMGSQ